MSKLSLKCANCSINSIDDGCIVCKGSLKVTGNDHIAKFFDYLTNFKLGIQNSYCPSSKSNKLLKYRGSDIAKRRERSSRLSNTSNRTSNRQSLTTSYRLSDLK